MHIHRSGQEMTKILHLSTTDVEGGAARAAYRLHQGLQSIGVTSQMLVRAKFSTEETIIPEKTILTKLGPPTSGLPLKLYPQRNRAMFSPQWFPDAIAPRVAQLNPDLVNLHWIGNGYLKIETLAKLKVPLVWTLHDMWSFTGGCHYTQNCYLYKESCGACPQLKSNSNWDLSRWIWQRKAKAWKNLDLTIVTPSLWLAKCASSSSLFRNLRVEVIPYGIDTQIYKPIKRQVARELLNLPQDKQLILFCSSSPGDRRKGFNLLQPALQNLSRKGWQDKIELVILGASQPESQSDLEFKSHYLGYLNDDLSLALVYAAADVFVAPSIQDNLPNTVMEAIACGTPSVAFDIGGMPDMIEHQNNGYLAQPFEIEDLAFGIAWVLEDSNRYHKLCHHARDKAEQEFTLEFQACRYLSLYNELTAN